MRHIVFAFYVFAFAAGFAALVFAVHLYKRYRIVALKNFSIFLLSLQLFMWGFIARAYNSVAKDIPEPAMGLIVRIIETAAGLIYIANAPFFYHNLTGRIVTRAGTIVTAILVTAMLALDSVYVVTGNTNLAMRFIVPAFYASVAYGIVLIAVRLKSITDPVLKKAIRTFFILSAAFFPLFLLDVFALPPNFLWGLSSMPVYLFVLSILGLRFSAVYFDHPAYFENDRPSGYFLEKFDISPRESEIVVLLRQGMSNKEIAGNLFVSPKTVENHIYSIYQKTGVKNRVELFNLLYSKRAN